MRDDILEFLNNPTHSAHEVIQADALMRSLEYANYLPSAKITITVAAEGGQVATGTFNNYAQLNQYLQCAMNNLVEELIAD